MLGHQRYRYTLRMCNTHCFSTAAMVARTGLNVTLLVHLLVLFTTMLRYWYICLSCLPQCYVTGAFDCLIYLNVTLLVHLLVLFTSMLRYWYICLSCLPQCYATRKLPLVQHHRINAYHNHTAGRGWRFTLPCVFNHALSHSQIILLLEGSQHTCEGLAAADRFKTAGPV
jgi:hypothetical protein